MAVPGALIPAGVAAPGGLLFKRLPENLFRPLASPNKHRYWGLLGVLYQRRFGPDAPMSPVSGFAVREITREIEEELLQQDEWELEPGEAPDTPLALRAIAVFNVLRDTGWLRMSRHGVEKRVDMHRDVRSFLGRLIEFAETEPVLVGAKISSIDANVLLVINGSGEHDAQLTEAADQARMLMEHVRNTGSSIRDLMESLHDEVSTKDFVRRFFKDFIERVFIGDYRELRTREHPLSRRGQILRRVEDLYTDLQARARLIAWYASKRTAGDPHRAERLFERDVQRLRDLQRLDEYLERLDDEIQRANKLALAVLDYRLRAVKPLDDLIQAASKSVLAAGDRIEMAPFPPGSLLGPNGLAEPRVRPERAKPLPFRKVGPTPVEIARARLMIAAREARSMNSLKLALLVRQQLAGKTEIEGSEMRMASIADLRALQSLNRIGMESHADSVELRRRAAAMARGFRVVRTDEDEIHTELISSPAFRLEAGRGSAAPAKGETK